MTCRVCKNEGYILKIDEDGDNYYIKCNCLKEKQNIFEVNKQLSLSNIPDSFYNYSIEDYVGADLNNNKIKISKYIDNYSDKFKHIHLYFYGGSGTQKTTLSKYMIKELIKKGFTGYYILFNNLVTILMKAERNEEEQELIKHLLEVDMLVIDEISKDKTTVYQSGYQIPFIITFIKDRMECKRRSTIFISNYDIRDEKNKVFGSHIIDLIERECSDTLVFEDNYSILKRKNIDTNLWGD